MPLLSKTKCLLCTDKVFQLPHHMGQKHAWNELDSKNTLNILRLRKLHKSKNKKIIPLKYMECPIETCPAIIKRVGQHLTQVHSIAKNSRKMIPLILKAKEACSS